MGDSHLGSPWRDVLEKLDSPFTDGRSKASREHRKTVIREGLGPVWNAQSRRVQEEILKQLSPPYLPTLPELIDNSKAMWATKEKPNVPIFCAVDIADIPEPEDSAFQRPEFQCILHEFREIRGKSTSWHNHGSTLERTLFRSWEALPKVVTEAAFHVVDHYYREVLTGPSKPNRQAFINEVKKKAKEAAWTRLSDVANGFLDRQPDPRARARAETWWRDIHHQLVGGRWEFFDLEQCLTLCGFIFSDDILPQPGTVAAILQHCEELKKAKEAAWTRLLDDADGFLDRCHRYQPDPRNQARAETWWRDIHHELVQGAWESLSLEQYRTLCGFMTAARFSHRVPQPRKVEAILRHCEEVKE
ncbi:hypothetical protein JCM1840_004781, partial [Sporobolomyces johnsonii]